MMMNKEATIVLGTSGGGERCWSDDMMGGLVVGHTDTGISQVHHRRVMGLWWLVVVHVSITIIHT